MTLTEALESMADRLDAILSASPDAATALLKYPEILEKEPALQEFVKRAAPQPRWNDHKKTRQRKTKTKNQAE